MINEGRELYMNGLKLYKSIIDSGKPGLRDLPMSGVDYNLGAVCEI